MMWGQELSGGGGTASEPRRRRGETRSQRCSSTGGEAAADTRQEETPGAVGILERQRFIPRTTGKEQQRWSSGLRLSSIRLRRIIYARTMNLMKLKLLQQDLGRQQRGRDGLVAMLPPAVYSCYTSAIPRTSSADVFRNNLHKNLPLFLKTKLKSVFMKPQDVQKLL